MKWYTVAVSSRKFVSFFKTFGCTWCITANFTRVDDSGLSGSATEREEEFRSGERSRYLPVQGCKNNIITVTVIKAAVTCYGTAADACECD